MISNRKDYRRVDFDPIVAALAIHEPAIKVQANHIDIFNVLATHAKLFKDRPLRLTYSKPYLPRPVFRDFADFLGSSDYFYMNRIVPTLYAAPRIWPWEYSPLAAHLPPKLLGRSPIRPYHVANAGLLLPTMGFMLLQAWTWGHPEPVKYDGSGLSIRDLFDGAARTDLFYIWSVGAEGLARIAPYFIKYTELYDAFYYPDQAWPHGFWQGISPDLITDIANCLRMHHIGPGYSRPWQIPIPVINQRSSDAQTEC